MKKLKIGFDDVGAAVKRGFITEAQAEKVWDVMVQRSAGTWNLSMMNVVIAILAGIAMLSFGVYAGIKIEHLTPLHIFGISVAIAGASLWGTDYAIRGGAHVVASALVTIAVVLTPIAVFALQMQLGYWPFTVQDIASHTETQRGMRDFHKFMDSRWLVMELSTIAVAAGVIAWRKFSFPLMPICIVLWYMVMDYTQYVDRHDNEHNFKQLYQWNSVYFGLAALAVAVIVDNKNKSRHDYGFWLYVAGVVSFWGGLVMMDSIGEWPKFQFACINLVLCLAAGYLQRWPLALFGGIGLMMYYGHLIGETFKNYEAFWLISGVAAVLALIALVWGMRNRDAIQEFFLKIAPEAVRRRVKFG